MFLIKIALDLWIVIAALAIFTVLILLILHHR